MDTDAPITIFNQILFLLESLPLSHHSILVLFLDAMFLLLGEIFGILGFLNLHTCQLTLFADSFHLSFFQPLHMLSVLTQSRFFFASFSSCEANLLFLPLQLPLVAYIDF